MAVDLYSLEEVEKLAEAYGELAFFLRKKKRYEEENEGLFKEMNITERGINAQIEKIVFLENEG